MATLATYHTAIRLLLDDVAEDNYSDDLITENLSLALSIYSQRKPLARTYVLDSTGSKRITLPADFAARAITGVEWVSSLADFTDEIAFYAVKVDEQWVIELPGYAVPLGETFNVYYQAEHTIDGLDSAAGTTVPDEDHNIVAMGAAGFCMLAGSTSKVESNNLNTQEAKDLAAHGRKTVDEFYMTIGAVLPIYTAASWHNASIDRNF